jgi:TatD DNase family protein
MDQQPYIVDSHCHLNYKGLVENLDMVLEAARKVNVRRFLAINTRISEFDQVHAIAKSHDEVFCSVGIHPHEAENEAADLKKLISLSCHEKVVGIGETGLDYYYQRAPKPEQKANFRTHIEAAAETGLPLIVHSRDAEADTHALLSERAGDISGVMHCFTASVNLAKKALDLGLFVSFSGIITFRNAENVRAAAKIVPDDRILVETDAPYLAPVPHRGKPCQPAYVADTLKFLAELRGTPEAEMAAITTRNFFDLFQRAGKAP